MQHVPKRIIDLLNDAYAREMQARTDKRRIERSVCEEYAEFKQGDRVKIIRANGRVLKKCSVYSVTIDRTLPVDALTLAVKFKFTIRQYRLNTRWIEIHLNPNDKIEHEN